MPDLLLIGGTCMLLTIFLSATTFTIHVMTSIPSGIKADYYKGEEERNESPKIKNL